MPTKHLFTLLITIAVSAGCNLIDRQQPPNVSETPPYLLPQSEFTRSQLEDMRAFHEKESAKMSEDIRVARNREMERLAAVGKELDRDKHWQEDYEKTQERRAKWTSWFTRTNKNDPKAATPVMSSRIGSTSTNVR